MSKHRHIFLTRADQHIQEINRQLDRSLNHLGPMVFVENNNINPTTLSVCCYTWTRYTYLYSQCNS